MAWSSCVTVSYKFRPERIEVKPSPVRMGTRAVVSPGASKVVSRSIVVASELPRIQIVTQ